MRKFKFLAFLILTLSIISFAQAQQSTQDIENRVNAIIKQMTLEEKIDYLGGVDDFYVRDYPRLKVPKLKMSDGPFGARNYGPSTTVGGLGLAATWDPSIAEKMGKVVGQDARARGVHFMLGPGVNIYRSPLNGRNFEYLGEDPFLAARTTAAYIRGMQSEGVSATVKHYLGNNSEFLRHDSDSIIDERTLREIYMPAFEAAVKDGHTGALMTSYNLINGQHASQNGYLNNEVLKKDWGFNGVIMSDWTSTYDGIAAVNGGLDLEMPFGQVMNKDTLLPAIRAGKVSEATIDEHVRRILTTAARFGWLDREQTDASISLYNVEGRKVALEAARSAMVLLKNDGNVLPFDKSRIKTIALFGPDAYPGEPVGGGSAGVKPFHTVSYLEGLANGGDVKVLYDRGIPEITDLADRTQFTTAAQNGKPGVNAEYYRKDNFTDPISKGIAWAHQPWPPDTGLPNDLHAARWTGYYDAKSAGKYYVFAKGPGEEGGYRVYVDDKLVIDSWDWAKVALGYQVLDLNAGQHKVKVESKWRFSWGAPRFNFGIIPTDEIVNAEVKKLASQADVVVVGVGFSPDSETEGADRTFGLPPGQNELINAALDANKNVVVVITSGGGVDMTSWVDRTPAILQAWYAGQEGGAALAQLLYGEFSPSGKLPVTFERRWEDNPAFNSYYPKAGDKSKKVVYTEGVFIGYRGYEKNGTKPLFPFGHGLSYTTFAYKNLNVTSPEARGDGPVTISFDITNTGQRDGSEIAQVYVGDKHSKVPRPAKELKGYSKVTLKPGETKRVEVQLDRRAFSYYDVSKKAWTVDPGEFQILVGASSADIALHGTVEVK